MRLTIIPVDGFVSVDGNSKVQPLDITACGIPQDIHALQWYESRGWIEYSDDDNPFTPKPANEELLQLPEWANNCVEVWRVWTPPVVEEPVVEEPVVEPSVAEPQV